MNIDVDSHFLPLEIFRNAPSGLKDIPRLVDGGNREQDRVFYPTMGTKAVSRACTEKELKLRIDAMKEAGFDKQCLLVLNGAFPDSQLDEECMAYLCAAWNDAVQQVCEEYDCFVKVAQIPHSSVEAAMEEAERAVRELGFRAIEIHGRWGGPKNVESPDWWPFFEMVEKLDVPLWFHTYGMMTSGKLNPWMPASDLLHGFPPYVNSLMGFFIHPQLVCAGLIFGGVMERFPKLKIALTECDAGWVPSFMDWLDMVRDAQLMRKEQGILGHWLTNPSFADVKLRKKPSQYMRDHFFFTLTTTSGFSMNALLPFLVNTARLEGNLLIESDFDHTEGSLDIVRRVRTLESISEEARDKICGRNAAELLKIKWTPSLYAWH